MGSVRDLYTTGDNDPEIESRQYYRHYLYCDACGSFELETWIDGDPERRENQRHVLAVAALLATPLVLVALWSVLGFVPSPEILLALVGGALLVTILLAAREYVKWNARYLGLRCRRCHATYAYGTEFFTDLDANPRQATVKDVPRPLGSSPFQRGASVQSAANEPSNPPSP